MSEYQSIPHILIFDSGVGGLSIVEAIQQQHSLCSLSYACDNRAFPYGTKPETQLIERVDKVLHQLQAQTQADILVIACNTASTLALPHIRERFTVPVVGVVPAIKPAAQLSKSNTIGLLATPATVNRDYTDALINEFASHCDVVPIGSCELVALAENKLRGEVVTQEQIHQVVSPFLEHTDMDTVVLACTHFPRDEDSSRTCGHKMDS